MTIKSVTEAAQKITVGRVHVYNPSLAGLNNSSRKANTAPTGAMVIPLQFTTFEGQVLALYEWFIEDPVCPGVELNVDYCVADCLHPLSIYAGFEHGQLVDRATMAAANFKAYVAEEENDKPLPRSSSQVLFDMSFTVEDRKDYERAARTAAMFSAMKGKEFTAMDVIDLLMFANLAAVDDKDKAIAARQNVTSLAALSVEEAEGIMYGSGPSQVDVESFVPEKANKYDNPFASGLKAFTCYDDPNVSEFNAMVAEAQKLNIVITVTSGRASFYKNGFVIHECIAPAGC